MRCSKQSTLQLIGIFLFSIGLGLGFSQTREYEIQCHSLNFNEKKIVKLFNKSPIKKVILRSFHNGHQKPGLMYSNSVLKVSHPTLDRMIPEFAERDFDLWGWMITRKINWLTDNSLYDIQFKGGHLQKMKRMDLFNPDAVQMIVSAYKDLASKSINGILIQDDLIIRSREGLSNWGKAQFYLSTGIEADDDMWRTTHPLHPEWVKIKVSQVNKVLKKIVDICKTVNPDIKIGMNIYYEAPCYEEWAKNWYAHDLGEICQTGIDYIYLMSYHRQIKKEMKWSDQKNKEYFKEMVQNAMKICKEKAIIKLQLRDWNTGKLIPKSEIEEYLNLISSDVKRICFATIHLEDYQLIKGLIK